MVIYFCVLFYFNFQFILPDRIIPPRPTFLPHPHQCYTIPPFYSTDSFTLLSDHPPDCMIHLDPRSRPPASAMGIPANMPTAYHYNHLRLLTLIPIPTPSILTSRITTLLELLDRTLETSFYTLATIYLATQSITEDLNHQEMVWYK
jgi:hypothetical protein